MKVEMWPNGDPAKARILSVATFALEAVVRGLVKPAVVRTHSVRLFKDAAFIPGGEARFSDSTLYTAPTQRDVWKNLTVTGHTTGLPGAKARGTWDLIGGALKVVLGGRLDEYRRAP